MSKRGSEPLDPGALLYELLIGERPRQVLVAESLRARARILAAQLENHRDISPSPTVREQFISSFDVIEEKLAKLAGLSVENKQLTDVDRRYSEIGVHRREAVRRKYISILGRLGVKDSYSLTAAQRWRLKALLRKGLHSIEPDLGSDDEFLKDFLSGWVGGNP